MWYANAARPLPGVWCRYWGPEPSGDGGCASGRGNREGVREAACVGPLNLEAGCSSCSIEGFTRRMIGGLFSTGSSFRSVVANATTPLPLTRQPHKTAKGVALEKDFVESPVFLSILFSLRQTRDDLSQHRSAIAAGFSLGKVPATTPKSCTPQDLRLRFLPYAEVLLHA